MTRKSLENSGEGAEEIEEKKAKPKKKNPKEPKIATFPMEGFVNKYHFI